MGYHPNDLNQEECGSNFFTLFQTSFLCNPIERGFPEHFPQRCQNFPSSDFAVEKGLKGALRGKVVAVKEEVGQKFVKAGSVIKNTSRKASAPDAIVPATEATSSPPLLPDNLDFNKIYQLGMSGNAGDASSGISSAFSIPFQDSS